MHVVPFRRLPLVLALGLAVPLPAVATNGMNMEGYGPIAAAMGGASMGYDNGTAAMMNNPATLGMTGQGARMDVFFGFLGPDVEAEHDASGMKKKSAGTSYWMPALGYIRKQDRLTYGLGMYGQGGMGTEYGKNSFMSMGYPDIENRTELSVGRVILPIAYNLNDQVTVGGSVDFVWAGLDLQMAMSEAQFANMANPMAQDIGTASGSLVNAFGAMYEPFGGSGIDHLNYAYFDYSNDNRFSGKARGYGAAAKLGIAYKLNDQWTLGATYHSKTRLGDLETDDATIRMGVNADFTGSYQDYDIPVTGKISVKDFQWPATWAIGAAFQATDKLLLVADIKRIEWASTMQDFRMVFTADGTQGNMFAGGFAGLELDAALYQDWDDQTVYQVGGAYQLNEQWTLRAGYNYASNPVPDKYLNALFPAVVEDHITAGFGYQVSDTQTLDFSLQHAPKVSFTNPGIPAAGIPAVTSRHSQTSFQFIYTFRF